MLEYTDEENNSFLLMVQCKAKDDLEFDHKKQEQIFYFDQSHYEYWLKYPIKTIITYSDINNTDECYWNHFSENTIEKTRKNYKIAIKKTSKFPNDELFEILFSSKFPNEIKDFIPSKEDSVCIEYNKVKIEIEKFDYYTKEISNQLRKFDSYIHYLLYDVHSDKAKTFFKIHLKDYKKQHTVAQEKDYIKDYTLNLNHSSIKNIYDLLEDFYEFIYSNFTKEAKIWLQEKYPNLHFEASESRFQSKEFWEKFFGANFGPIVW